ncbi:MAG: hypothetical protein V5A88_00505 [Candidatus Thermoplasmatota archaeon]
MKNLLTHCPRCRAHFHVNEENRVAEKVQVTCPYCGFNYRDLWEKRRVKETKYYWELNRGLNPYPGPGGGKESRLKIGGGFLLLAVAFFTLGSVSLFLFEDLSVFRGGVGIAGSFFLVLTIIGALNTFRARSFAVSLSGGIFAVLGSVLWGGLNSDSSFFLLGDTPPALYLFSSLFLSLSGLILIIKNRKMFHYGY